VHHRRYTDRRELARSAAELILDDCRRSLADRSRPYAIGVSGGSTPTLMFEEMAALPMPWSDVHVFQVDERVAPAGSADRNLTQLTDCLLARVEIPSENIHPMPVESDDLRAACQAYEREIESVTRDAPLDMVQLGLGDDGHTASLAPGDPILDVSDRDVWHVEEFNGLPRMSMTYPAIDRSRKILWLAVGHTKAEMCRRLIASDREIPAGRVSQHNATLLVDEEAAAYL
jgi:6-phosphogluconolactonase